MTVLSNAQMLALIIGFLSPIVLSAIKRPLWSERVQALLTFLFSVAVSVATALVGGDFAGQPLLTVFLLTFVTAISSYKGFWKPTGVTRKVEKHTGGVAETSKKPTRVKQVAASDTDLSAAK